MVSKDKNPEVPVVGFPVVAAGGASTEGLARGTKDRADGLDLEKAAAGA